MATITTKQQKVAKCLETFIDRAYHPDYRPTAEDWELYFKVETSGPSSVTPEQLPQIAPLREAKGDYDLQIKMVYSEAAEWWSNGWGWSYPIDDAIRGAMEDPALEPYVIALDKIRDSFASDSLGAVTNYSGFTPHERQTLLKRYENQLSA